MRLPWHIRKGEPTTFGEKVLIGIMWILAIPIGLLGLWISLYFLSLEN